MKRAGEKGALPEKGSAPRLGGRGAPGPEELGPRESGKNGD